MEKINQKILKGLEKEKNGMSISDMERDLKIPRGQIRIAVANLMGANKIEEEKFGMAKVYFLK